MELKDTKTLRQIEELRPRIKALLQAPVFMKQRKEKLTSVYNVKQVTTRMGHRLSEEV